MGTARKGGLHTISKVRYRELLRAVNRSTSEKSDEFKDNVVACLEGRVLRAWRGVEFMYASHTIHRSSKFPGSCALKDGSNFLFLN